jgi:hypothetical protein
VNIGQNLYIDAIGTGIKFIGGNKPLDPNDGYIYCDIASLKFFIWIRDSWIEMAGYGRSTRMQTITGKMYRTYFSSSQKDDFLYIEKIGDVTAWSKIDQYSLPEQLEIVVDFPASTFSNCANLFYKEVVEQYPELFI